MAGASNLPGGVGLGGIRAGQMIGQYRVEGLLGRGGMGVVYQAHHEALDRFVAIKLMSGLVPDQATADRFLREARAVSRMRHANVLAVFDYGSVDGVPFMVTEYMPGGSLSDLLGGGPLEPALAIHYLRGIAAGIDYAHESQIIHRDIKPSNVLLSAKGEAILADFGLAKILSNQSQRSQSGFISGTVAYMAPEQASELPAGPAADVYSFAIMAFELLVGQLPFPGENVLEVLLAQIQKQPPAPSSINADLNPAVDEVILRGLAKEPSERWSSCSHMVSAIEAALAQVPARRDAALDTVRISSGARSRRRIGLRAGAVTIVLLLLGVVGLMAVGKSVFRLGTQPLASTRPALAGGTAVLPLGGSPDTATSPTPQTTPSSPTTPLATPSAGGGETVAGGGAPAAIAQPTAAPVFKPTAAPTVAPTAAPPTAAPTVAPTVAPAAFSNPLLSGPPICVHASSCGPFTATPVGGSGSASAYQYSWSASGSGTQLSNLGNSSTIFFTPPSAGSWRVTCTVTYEGSSRANGTSVTVT